MAMNGEPPFIAFMKFLLLFGAIPAILILTFAMMGAKIYP
jgi:hypothetical protein